MRAWPTRSFPSFAASSKIRWDISGRLGTSPVHSRCEVLESDTKHLRRNAPEPWRADDLHARLRKCWMLDSSTVQRPLQGGFGHEVISTPVTIDNGCHVVHVNVEEMGDQPSTAVF